MIRDDEINAVLRECAQASGLLVLERMNGGGGFERCEASDEVEARVAVTFQTFLPRPNSRPVAEVKIHCEELTAEPRHVAQIVRERVSVAKQELINQMKATIARLEALP